MNMALFSSSVVDKVCNDEFNQNKKQFQEMFFYLIKDLCLLSKKKDLIKLCAACEKNGSWEKVSTQTKIMNNLYNSCVDSKIKSPFTEDLLNFSAFKKGVFSEIEHIKYLLYYFSGDISKEDIISELNFVREQQRQILPCMIDTRKTNFSAALADEEILIKSKNMKFLKNIDFGFKVHNVKQIILEDNENYRMEFSRNVECKVFRETDFLWQIKPYFDITKNKIIAQKSERDSNKNAFYKKYLYQERNVFTHSGEIYAIRALFKNSYQNIEEWLENVLSSLYDAREFLRKNSFQKVSDMLLNLLDYYFLKIVSNTGLDTKNKSADEVWKTVFNEKGKIELTLDQIKKTNIFDVLNKTEIQGLEKLMKFLFCTSYEQDDFIEKNKIQIVLYLIYVSMSLSKIDGVNKN